MRRSYDYKRSDRVSELVKHELSQILFKEIKDPAIGTVTVTRVVLTEDLRSGQVYYGVLERTARAEEVQLGLERASAHIHRILGRRLRLKYIPKLTFHYDRNLDYSFRISKILSDLEGEES